MRDGALVLLGRRRTTRMSRPSLMLPPTRPDIRERHRLSPMQCGQPATRAGGCCHEGGTWRAWRPASP